MKAVCFGEIMLRLASPGYNRLFQVKKMDSTFCGSEANVAVSLANFGISSTFVTKIPHNDIGKAVINELNYFGVNTNDIIFGGDRLGLFYLEKGASQRPSKVIYDRKNSAIAEAETMDFDWIEIFEDVDWFHFSGINPALSDSMADISLEACKIAKELGITVSCDLNYRKNLWSSEKANKVMSQLMKYVDVCIANEEDADKVFGIKANETNVDSGIINFDSYKNVAQKISKKFECRFVAITLRTSLSANDNKWAGAFYSAESDSYFVSNEYDIHIVDRVGSGDSFAAGIIYALLQKMDYRDCIEFAVAASCLKHSIEGDFNRVSLEEINALMNGNASGRVVR